MHSQAKRVSALFLPALLSCMLLLGACENDLNKIKEISAKLVSQPIDTARGVEVIYSDSAIVKGKMLTPLMIVYNFTPATAYNKMPNGVKVIFYDQYHDLSLREKGNIVADSAVSHDNNSRIEFYKNVVATNAKGETFKSQELIWDQAKKLIYSNKPVQITMVGGNIINSTDFKSDETLQHPVMNRGTGEFNVSDMPAK